MLWIAIPSPIQRVSNPSGHPQVLYFVNTPMTTLLGSFLQDVRYGFRNLARNPGFALIAMLTLALGIGANTTIFSILNSTVLRKISFPDADRLVLVLETFGKGPNNW